MDLFDRPSSSEPLASQSRPSHLSEMVGQQHLIGSGGPLYSLQQVGLNHSLILWGPPGVGKTTLARLLAQHCDAYWIELSAVMIGMAEIRTAVEQAKVQRQQGRTTVLFIDEIHRFNKTQQDAFLPHMEDGTLILMGATTENPAFELNRALLSRAQVYRLKKLSPLELTQLLIRIIEQQKIAFDGDQDKVIEAIVIFADGDARRAISGLERLNKNKQTDRISRSDLDLLGDTTQSFDRQGDHFYDQISALHKSIRGSSTDGALYWLCRMLEGGCDPLYIARRLVRIASEDIGNADPRALTLCVNAWDAQQRLGSPEGELSLAQATLYLASAPKSNAVYKAFKAMRQWVREDISREVPNHLRNAPTALHAEQGFGDDYRYAHDVDNAYVAGERYLPVGMPDTEFYQPVERGLEAKIREKLDYLKALDHASQWQRDLDKPSTSSPGEAP